ncbi:[FeFe] hydrogenase H-cluster maturation GTPase HydF [Clostridium tetanomorphum]|uniref:[FeFe] hydrogenase H-cluster maturation GTPase HydF n=1 Tax=Clostridium tetanomorphum TaxID=1553 RepID=A0A923EEF8_CLOTT|nr:[FeFe] hydrogenase H-cluster maturation GTPase HydF [Clostridium tetanomorphum]KAJ52498.1 [FeFe]-hydrogenase maturation GTPase HydF [Clostridium tetanomorphum DSM 665]MBC2399470.1 [FeFe] hydrogenase H-cluster maturation GTPase HydF [Clostridium tetanomorphum]MBP1864177.1 [FeFe] hydrogenase H-cluster maturation GTPase HydF [Clostridium tetanomorphum]NRS84590.1 [FeFe] hydrogenase H-cluster maturation GTPase HydF [Clostridium tetanomorphum]NRZ97805.1 [FeFe] hydrogenase H-cluster maturation GTP
MIDTPKGNRLHIAIFGRRNAGKSSIINALTNQEISIVSNTAGTTTDPVYKAMELLPIGPVMIIDTAGLDDLGEVGELRIKKTKEVMDKTDLALLIFSGNNKDLSYEKHWYEDLKKRNIPVIGVVNKIDEIDVNIDEYKDKFSIPFIKVSALKKINIEKLKDKIIENSPIDFEMPTLIGDIVNKNHIVLLVAPQDIQAPKGRLILPQVQTIRDLLDNDTVVITVKCSELEYMINNINIKPNLVITDSQVFKKVNDIIPKDIPLTSFSILMARFKGELKTFIQGAKAIDELKPGDKVLIAEACTHHALKGDIGREKIPNWLKERAGGEINITVNAGIDFPEDISKYKLIIHCGACMFNRKQMMSRILKAKNYNVPITNYGIAIAHINGILDRVTNIFN